MLRTKIVCTIGPASRAPEMLRELMLAGMDVARLNFSHGSQFYHGENIERIRAVAAEVGKPVAILTDLQGPKLRVGEMEGEGVLLVSGEKLILTTRHVVGHGGEAPVQYTELPQDVEPGDRILIDDGLLELEVLSTDEETDITCRVITGGLLQTNKGMNLPRASHAIPTITDKDRRDLRFVLEQRVDWVALSFVRNSGEVLKLREMIRELSADRPVPVVAKIEKPEAVDNIDGIIEAADAIMVARGDLGVETSPEAVPIVQKMIIAKCNAVGKPVITATQMLDSMMRNPRPTRAEASDVANAILDGADAIMLSGETAVGKYPLESVRTMARIALEAERSGLDSAVRPHPPRPVTSIANAVSHATCATACDLAAAAIITPTISGHTARIISKYRPPCPIIAVTPSPVVQRQLALHWGVHPLLSRRTDSTDETISGAVRAAQKHGLVKQGDVVVITAGAAGSGPGTTDIMKVQVV